MPAPTPPPHPRDAALIARFRARSLPLHHAACGHPALATYPAWMPCADCRTEAEAQQGDWLVGHGDPHRRVA